METNEKMREKRHIEDRGRKWICGVQKREEEEEKGIKIRQGRGRKI